MQTIWGLLYAVNTFVPTLLLKGILEYFESPTSDRSPWLYVSLLLVSGIVSAIAGSQPLWIGRQLCMNIRALVGSEIYGKALKRQTATSQDNLPDSGTSSQANTGKIINLMSVDSVKISEGGAYLFSLWAETPVQIGVAIVLLYRILGLSSLTGIGVMILLMPVNTMIAKSLTKTQTDIMSATDARIHATNELLQNIRLIKLFAWDRHMRSTVEEKRRVELKMLRSRFIIWSLFSLLTRATPLLITFFTFLVYSKVQEKPLLPSITFPALSLFGILQAPLNQITSLVARFQAFKVSLARVQEFLLEPETGKYQQLSTRSKINHGGIRFSKATMTWSTIASDNVLQGLSCDAPIPNLSARISPFRLTNIDLEFRVGKLNIVVGPTGSGKTSLLLALLGELTLLEGDIYLPDDRTFFECPSSKIQLKNSIAYCSQQAWLINSSIKQNIVFAGYWSEERYQEVVTACALDVDFANLTSGDETLVGEKGIALSGGQKQRISLARAIYSDAAHLILDDCLSALDSNTAQWIYENGIQGSLMHGRTCILSTHNMSLCVPDSDFVVVLDTGRVVHQGLTNDVLAAGGIPGLSGSDSERNGSVSSSSKSKDNGDMKKQKNEAKSHEVQSQAERKSEGVVAFRHIQRYLDAMGGKVFWIFAIVVFVASPLGAVATNLWVRQWSNAEERNANTTARNTQISSSAVVSSDLSYYLGIYGLISIIYLIVLVARDAVQFGGSLRASRRVHTQLLERVTRAKLSFFDTTPLGQMVNRFSSDIELLDQELAPLAVQTLDCVTSIATTIILISIFSPLFLLAGAFVSIIYYYIGKYFLSTSRDLKRIEAVTKSPLYQHFGETLSGLTTIRAFGHEKRFMTENFAKLDAHSGPYFYLWAANRWLAFRVDIMGAIVAFCAGAFVLSRIDKIDAGAAGVSLLYAVTFTENVVYLIRLQASNEQNLNA